MMAYLVMMAVRLKELHRVLKPTGSLYLHCDPTASHYLKILLDTIFGAERYRNEINWKRTSSHNDAKRKYGNVCDVIFFYTKTDKYTFNVQYSPYSEEYIRDFYRYTDENGRRYRIDNMRSPNPRPNLTYDYKGYKPHPNGWAVSLERMEQLDREGRLHFPKTQDGRIQLKRFLDEMSGVPLSDVWSDLSPIHAHASELLGYPTQKPVALLERIVSASSNEGDVVLDPFCGCGTTIAAAQKLNREWIGIDITHLSVGLQKLRLRDSFGLEPAGRNATVKERAGRAPEGTLVDTRVSARDGDSRSVPPAVAGGLTQPGDDAAANESIGSKQPTATAVGTDIGNRFYRVIGQPEDLEGAKELADKDKYGFQWWILPLIGAKAFGSEAGKKEGKKGADGGIDGMIVFTDDNSGKAKKVIVSVKGGHVNVSQIRDLGHVVEREKAAIGIFLTLEKPTKPMIEEAVGKGFYHSDGWNRDYPRIQILTVEEVLAGKQPELPPSIDTFKKASKASGPIDDQGRLGFPG